MRGGKRYGFEFKFEDAPATTKSMHHAIEDLELDHLWVVSPGTRSLPLTDRISIMPLMHVPSLADKIK